MSLVLRGGWSSSIEDGPKVPGLWGRTRAPRARVPGRCLGRSAIGGGRRARGDGAHRAGPDSLSRRDRRVRGARARALPRPRAQGRDTERTRRQSRRWARRRSTATSRRGSRASTSAPTPLPARSAARRRGLGRAAQLVSDQRRLAGQSRHLPRASPPRPQRRRPAQRPLEHDRRDHPRRAGADLRRPRARRRARRRPLPDAGVARRGARPLPGRRRGVDRVSDLLRRGRRRRRAVGGLPRPRACRWSSTKPGALTFGSRRFCPRAPWSAAPTSSSPRCTSCSAA